MRFPAEPTLVVQSKNKTHLRLGLAVAAVFVLVGAAGAQPTPKPAAAVRSEIRNLIPVPLCRQSTDYTCGAAALQSVLGYYGLDIREGTLAKALHADPQTGTRYSEMARFARARGFRVNVQLGMTVQALKSLVDRRIPVIVLLQAWSDRPVDYSSDWDDGHYAVVVGYDEKRVFFMDPATLGHYTYIPLSSFVRRWHDREGTRKLERFGMTLTRSARPAAPEAVLPLE